MEKESEINSGEKEVAEIKVPAVLFLLTMKKYLDDLTREEKGEFLEDYLAYGMNKTIPEAFSSPLLKFCFTLAKDITDENERKYIAKCKRARNSANTKKAKNKLSDEGEGEEKVEGRSREPTGKDKPPGEVQQGKMTEIQAGFLKAFKELCPNQAINCTISDFPDVDLNALMLAIQRSPQYLMNAEKNQNLGGLRWYLENATKIIAGRYKKFEDVVENKSRASQSFTTDELEQLSKPKE